MNQIYSLIADVFVKFSLYVGQQFNLTKQANGIETLQNSNENL